MAQFSWQLDPMHSEVNFRVRHLVISTVSGSFATFQSTLTTEEDDFGTAQVELTIDAASINTGVADRDNHLRSDDFFNAEKFPQIHFKSTGVTKSADGKIHVNGDLTIRDITKPLTLEVDHGGIMVDFYNNTKAGFELEGKISRKEFGLMWDAVTEAGGVVVGDEVKFQINLQYAKA
ncbi:MAG: YceI family protein [Saprospiraceae bacterium]|jgi:polyisoprenoid-binding protein YceI